MGKTVLLFLKSMFLKKLLFLKKGLYCSRNTCSAVFEKKLLLLLNKLFTVFEKRVSSFWKKCDRTQIFKNSFSRPVNALFSNPFDSVTSQRANVHGRRTSTSKKFCLFLGLPRSVWVEIVCKRFPQVPHTCPYHSPTSFSTSNIEKTVNKKRKCFFLGGGEFFLPSIVRQVPASLVGTIIGRGGETKLWPAM